MVFGNNNNYNLLDNNLSIGNKPTKHFFDEKYNIWLINLFIKKDSKFVINHNKSQLCFVLYSRFPKITCIKILNNLALNELKYGFIL